jgi:hypothetical protein
MNESKFLSPPFVFTYALLFTAIALTLVDISYSINQAPTSTGVCNCTNYCPADASCNNGTRRIDLNYGNMYQIPNDAMIGGIRKDSDKIYAAALKNNFRCPTATCPAGSLLTYSVQLIELDTAFFISKVMLDQIFNYDHTTPGIDCRLRYDGTKHKLFLAVKPETEDVTKCQPSVINAANTHVYADRIYCPTQCN